jgi:hypothetical protein
MMRLPRHVECMGDMRNVCKVLFGNPKLILGIDGRIILKWNKMFGVKVSTELI